MRCTPATKGFLATSRLRTRPSKRSKKKKKTWVRTSVFFFDSPQPKNKLQKHHFVLVSVHNMPPGIACPGNMKKLLAAKTAFGIIPGGSEDVAIHQHGQENVYINRRYGFIKYALQHGYSLILAYTFGENDQFYSLSCLRPLNLWLVKRFLATLKDPKNCAVFVGGKSGCSSWRLDVDSYKTKKCRFMQFMLIGHRCFCYEHLTESLLFRPKLPSARPGFGFVLPIFWGKKFFPLLPRGGGLNTVYGRVIHLPTIQDPSVEDLVKWHAFYVEELKSMFDEYKVKFGYGDRELHCF